MLVLKNSKRTISGQGMTEYLIIVALIAVAAIGVYGLMGSTVRNQVASMTAELGGRSGKTATNNAKSSASDALSVANDNDRVTLGNYNAAGNDAIK